jgi:hypothetical protein
MNKYTLTIECDVLNEMGLSVTRTISVATTSEPLPGDVYEFLIGRSSHPVIVKVLDVISTGILKENIKEVYCHGEEIDEIDSVKQVFEWLSFSFD